MPTAKPVSIRPHWMRFVPKAPTMTEAMRPAAPLSATSLPSMAPKMMMSVRPSMMLPTPRLTTAGTSWRGMPRATPATSETMMNEMNASILRREIRRISPTMLAKMMIYDMFLRLLEIL